MIPFFELKTQYLSIKDEIDNAISGVFDRSNFILGEKVSEFEKKFSGCCKAKYGVGVGSGTEALHLALAAAKIGKGDEVILPSFNFVAAASAICLANATPAYADIDDYFTIDASKIEEKITKKTKAIIPVHLYGQPADMKPITEIAEKYNLKIIEDCCQAHGSSYNGKKVPFSGIGCFSFYPTKNLGAYGDSGMAVTNDNEIYENLIMLRNHGQSKKYYSTMIGVNSRLDELQAAILLVKLKYLDSWNEQRRKRAKLYASLLDNAITPMEREKGRHVYHLYVIRSKKRDSLQDYLKSNGVNTLIHYPYPIHAQEGYSAKVKLPKTEEYTNEILSLPMYPELKETDIIKVSELIKKFSH